ncbi:MAG: hypothetical protein HYW91_03750 [Candidatus Sungbacteria bacterium]|nr:hypothetical protein [Candidatus Sungbacteria bacterium]
MDTSKAIELIEKSEHLGLLLPKDASFDCLAAADVFAGALGKKGKKTGVLGNGALKSAVPYIFKNLGSLDELPREFVVSLDTSRSPISQLRYEKGENRIDIILSPKESSVPNDALSFRNGKAICACIAAIGVVNIEEAAGAVGADPDLLTNTPIINVNNGPTNKNYGEANVTDETKSSVSELVYQLLSSAYGDLFDRDAATLLLAGIVSATGGFRAGSTSADTLLVSSELMRLGADLEEAHELVKERGDVGLAQLLGRASVRSRLDEDQKILWSFLTKEDFEKTGRSPEDISGVLSRLDSEFPRHRISASLWQDPADERIYATLSGERPALEALRSAEGGEFKSPYLKLSSSFASFREAEEKIASLF